jgi:hypothetical protein
MKTTGTNTEGLSDADLRTHIASAALDVYEAILQGFAPYEVWFAQETLGQFTDELLHRSGGDRRPDIPAGTARVSGPVRTFADGDHRGVRRDR